MNIMERMYQAMHRRTGIKFSFDDLRELIVPDDAIKSRMQNFIARRDCGGGNDFRGFSESLSVFKKRMQEEA